MGRGLKTMLAFLVLCSLFAAVPSIRAYWVLDGVALCTATGTQQNPTITSASEGSAIVAWSDDRSGNADIYAQRVDALGVIQWASDGVVLCTAAGSQVSPVSISDGDDGTIVTWVDNRSGNYDVYAQRVNGSGTVQWTADAAALCTATGGQLFPAISSDGFGGAIVAWCDSRGGTNDIYARRVSASGEVLWTADGVALCTANGSQQYPAIAFDGAGGAIITWYDDRSGTNDIYAQRVSASGEVLWTADGVAVCTASGAQQSPTIVSDGFGGATITWHDGRSGTNDIYAQRVNASGVAQWPVDGVALSAATGTQLYPKIISDGAGGAIVTWYDNRSGAYDVYAQRVDASGAVLWTADGVALCTAAGPQQSPAIITDGAGGALVAWQDRRSGGYDVYAQRVDASGSVQWTADGIPLCTAAGSRGYPKIAPDGAGGAIAAWHDSRGDSTDVYAQLIDRHGRIGFIAPQVCGVRDVPGDQGGKVYLSWYAARLDVYMDAGMSYYSIWRAISPTRAAAAVDEGVSIIEAVPELERASGRRIIRMEHAGALTYIWELVGTIDASYREAYGMPVATLFDSTAVYDDYHYFQVIAHTKDPKVFWESEPDSGYSVDNLAPSAPRGLAGECNLTPGGLSLTWNRNVETDIDRYRVYRGLEQSFIPGVENLIASSRDTACFDRGWRSGRGYCYKVSAVDVHGNESGRALLRSADIDGTYQPKAPPVTSLAQNFPNPFNPTTKIEFDLVAPGKVSLRIYDPAGHLVKALVDEVLPAARHERIWDGRDDAGRQVASGMYFYRLDAGTFESTRKMILVR